MSSFRFLPVVPLFLVASIALTACGEGEGSKDEGSEARIVSFTADPATVVEGESTTLHWSTKKAVSVILIENGIKLGAGTLPAEGSLVVRPSKDSRYRLEVADRAGRIAEARLDVTVEPFGAPRVESFTARPSVVGKGDTVTLDWKVAGAESLEIVSELGSRIAFIAPAPSVGSYEVRPTDSTTYGLRARNAAGLVTAEVEVTVAQRPTIALELSSTQASHGDEITLSWTVAHAESVVVFDPRGQLIHEGPGSNGSLVVEADRTGSYRATALGMGGEEHAHARLEVDPLIEDFRVVAQGATRPGSLALATWKVKGAERIVVSNGVADVIDTYADEQSESVKMSIGGAFILRAYSGSKVVERAASVQVVEEPLIRRLSRGALVTAGQGIVGKSTIGWEVDGASKLLLEVDPGGVIDLSDKSPRLDEIEVLFRGPGTVTLTAFNGAGSSKMVIPSPVDPVPTVEELFAAPSRAGMGEPVEIHWVTRDGHTVILEREGMELPVEERLVNGHHLTAQPITGPTSFVLRVFNTLGHEVVSDPIVVETGPPNQVRFTTKDGQRLYRVGTDVELVWENDGGTSLTVTNTLTGKQVCSETSWAAIRKGSCIIKMPEEQQDVPLVIEVQNGSGADSRTLDLQAVTGPIILNFFTPETDEITTGDSLLFSWEVLRDADGNIPTLTLEDDRGNVYDMSDVVGDAALLGTKRFRVFDRGDDPRIFTLTATSPVPPAYSLTTAVQVYGIPQVTSTAANPLFALEEGDRVVVSWTTEDDAVSVELYNLAEDGTVASTPFYVESDPVKAKAGSADAFPTIPEPHVRLVAVNPLGVRTVKDLRIGVDPATITTFTANGIEAPAVVDILEGESVDLVWETARSTAAEMDAGWGAAEFLDLRDRATATDTALQTVGDSGTREIVFPAGFKFPFYGTDATLATVTVDGWLSFNANATSSCCTSSVNLPSSSYSRVHVMPFWDDLYTSRHEPFGTVLWEYFDAPEPHLIVQWADMNFYNTARQPSSLNFQAVLFASGDIEMRWGVMEAQLVEHAEASTAIIGVHNRTGNKVRFVSNKTRVPGGLGGKSFYFFADPLPLQGNRHLTPMVSTTYALKAWNGHSEHTEEIEIRVHKPGKLEIWTVPADPAPGDRVALHWSGERLTSLSIADELGNPVLTASPTQLESGSIDLGVLAQGIYRYDFQAVGALPRDTIDRRYSVSVNAPFELVDFSASAPRIKKGEAVTLSWSTINATSLKIIEQPSGTEAVIPANELASGSRNFHPQVTSTYVLELESHERYRYAEEVVEVRTVWIDDFHASTDRVPVGGSFDLHWDTTVEGEVTMEPLPGMGEVDSAFEDISHMGSSLFGQSVDGGLSNVVFPAGFTFPYFGQNYSQVRIAVDGYVSFDMTATTQLTNQTIPNPSTSYSKMHLPIFWDDLNTGPNGKVNTAFFTNPDRFIIQWTNFQRYYPSANRNWNLNFQIVLFADGTFEYRYGAMDPPPGGGTSTSTDCNPLSCVDEANGSSATIGYQDPLGVDGFQFHYGGASSTNAPPFPGGLAGRSFRAIPPPQAGVGVAAGVLAKGDAEQITFTKCISDADWKECKDVTVDVIRPGDLLITEVMPMPAGGGAEWIEIRNLRSNAIDLQGMSLSNGTQTYEITTPLVVPEGGYAILASANDPTIQPDVVYAGWSLGGVTGTVTLEFDGIAIHTLSWGNAVAGVSFQVPGDKQVQGTASNPAGDLCSATTPYTGPNMGTPGAISDCLQHGYMVDFYSDRPFIDIRATGTEIASLNADTAVTTISGGIGFTMPYFSGTVSDLWVNSNGLVGFTGSSSNTSGNRDLPTTTTTPNGVVAAFWDDLTSHDIPANSSFHWERTTIDNLQVTILQWSRFKRWNQAGEITFQVQLWENGDIVIAFDHIEGNDYYRGADATVGIEGTGGTPDIQFLYNKPILKPYQRILFAR